MSIMSIKEWANEISDGIKYTYSVNDYDTYQIIRRIRKQIRGIIVVRLRKSISESTTVIIVNDVIKLLPTGHKFRNGGLEEFMDRLKSIIDKVLRDIRDIRRKRISEIAYLRSERRVRTGMESNPTMDWLVAETEVDIKLNHELYPRPPRHIHHMLRAEIQYRPGGIGYLAAKENFDSVQNKIDGALSKTVMRNQ